MAAKKRASIFNEYFECERILFLHFHWMMLVFLLALWYSVNHYASSTPVSSPNWEELKATDGVKFSARNGTFLFIYFESLSELNCVWTLAAHASCVFKGRIWVTGGRTAKYVTYDLLDSYRVSDVWSSANGGNDAIELLLFDCSIY